MAIEIGGVTLTDLIFFLVLLVGGLVLSSLVNLLLRRTFDPRLPRKYSKLIARVTQYALIVLVLYYGLTYVLALDLTAFLASLGILGIAIAISSQQVLQNLMAGLLIFITRLVRLEDWVEVGGIPATGVGRVKDITWTRTVLRNADGKIVYIPNSLLITVKVVNYTRAGFTEVPIELEVPLDVPFEEVRRIAQEVAEANPRIPPNLTWEERNKWERLFDLPQITRLFEKRPDLSMFRTKVLITGIADSNYKIQIRIWIGEIHSKEEIVSDFLEQLISRLREEGIELKEGD